jgi:hypothetical protein
LIERAEGKHVVGGGGQWFRQSKKPTGTQACAGPLKSLRNSRSYIMCEMLACGRGIRMIIGYCASFHGWPNSGSARCAIKAAGASRVFAAISSAVTDRKALSKAIAALQAGDVLLSLASIGSLNQPGTF